MIHPTENNAIAETEANTSYNFNFLQVDVVFSENDILWIEVNLRKTHFGGNTPMFW